MQQSVTKNKLNNAKRLYPSSLFFNIFLSNVSLVIQDEDIASDTDDNTPYWSNEICTSVTDDLLKRDFCGSSKMVQH